MAGRRRMRGRPPGGPRIMRCGVGRGLGRGLGAAVACRSRNGTGGGGWAGARLHGAFPAWPFMKFAAPKPGWGRAKRLRGGVPHILAVLLRGCPRAHLCRLAFACAAGFFAAAYMTLERASFRPRPDRLGKCGKTGPAMPCAPCRPHRKDACRAQRHQFGPSIWRVRHCGVPHRRSALSGFSPHRTARLRPARMAAKV